MAGPINPTNLTPPRVAFIDDRTGAISREWYRFFLSLLTAVQTTQDETTLAPDATSLLASYDAVFGEAIQGLESAPDCCSETANVDAKVDSLAQAVGAAPPNAGEIASLDSKFDSITQGLALTPQPELGTMAPLQQANVPWFTFNNAPTPVPTAVGSLYWDGGTTLGVQMTTNVLGRVNEDLYYYIKASSAITKGQVVMFTGAVGSSGVVTGAPATGVTNGSYIMGIAAESIALNGFGLVQYNGTLKGLNTSAFSDGDILWYNPAVTGGLTKTEPTAPNIKVQVAAVINAGSGGSGSILIRVTAGSVLGGTDSNVQFGTLANGDLIQYDSALQYWKNVSASSASIGTATNLAGGAANRIAYQTAPGTTNFITAPSVANTYLEWSGTAFQWSSNPLGTVTSVGMTVPTGLTVSGSPITTSGTLAVSLQSGYSIPTTASQTNWDTAYTDRLKWDGGSSGLVAATGRTSLGATTVGSNFFTLTNPSAITFPRINADNTVSALDAATFRTAIGAGTSSTTGTVTSVSGTGTVNGITLTGTVTSSGSLTLGGTLSGIGNSQLTNSSITINGSAISLGGSVSVGTVTTSSVASANGFAGTVANASTTPAITISTTVTGMVKGNGTSLSAATKDVDYVAPAAPLTKTADFTVGAGENWFINNKSGSTCTVTLPAASSFAGRAITFQNYQDQLLVSASSNVVPRAGGAAGTAILDNVAGNWATLVSDGTNWVIMQAAPFNCMLI